MQIQTQAGITESFSLDELSKSLTDALGQTEAQQAAALAVALRSQQVPTTQILADRAWALLNRVSPAAAECYANGKSIHPLTPLDEAMATGRLGVIQEKAPTALKLPRNRSLTEFFNQLQEGSPYMITGFDRQLASWAHQDPDRAKVAAAQLLPLLWEQPHLELTLELGTSKTACAQAVSQTVLQLTQKGQAEGRTPLNPSLIIDAKASQALLGLAAACAAVRIYPDFYSQKNSFSGRIALLNLAHLALQPETPDLSAKTWLPLLQDSKAQALSYAGLSEALSLKFGADWAQKPAALAQAQKLAGDMADLAEASGLILMDLPETPLLGEFCQLDRALFGANENLVRKAYQPSFHTASAFASPFAALQYAADMAASFQAPPVVQLHVPALATNPQALESIWQFAGSLHLNVHLRMPISRCLTCGSIGEVVHDENGFHCGLCGEQKAAKLDCVTSESQQLLRLTPTRESASNGLHLSFAQLHRS